MYHIIIFCMYCACSYYVYKNRGVLSAFKDVILYRIHGRLERKFKRSTLKELKTNRVNLDIQNEDSLVVVSNRRHLDVPHYVNINYIFGNRIETEEYRGKQVYLCFTPNQIKASSVSVEYGYDMIDKNTVVNSQNVSFINFTKTFTGDELVMIYTAEELMHVNMEKSGITYVLENGNSFGHEQLGTQPQTVHPEELEHEDIEFEDHAFEITE